MSDKEIIKALECCSKNDCDNCAHSKVKPQHQNCNIFICKNALDLIKRQQAEIKRLKIEKDNLIKTYKECMSDAIKEFAERLIDILEENRTINNHYYIDCTEALNAFNNLVAEMTESEIKR